MHWCSVVRVVRSPWTRTVEAYQIDVTRGGVVQPQHQSRGKKSAVGPGREGHPGQAVHGGGHGRTNGPVSRHPQHPAHPQHRQPPASLAVWEERQGQIWAGSGSCPSADGVLRRRAPVDGGRVPGAEPLGPRSRPAGIVHGGRSHRRSRRPRRRASGGWVPPAWTRVMVPQRWRGPLGGQVSPSQGLECALKFASGVVEFQGSSLPARSLDQMLTSLA